MSGLLLTPRESHHTPAAIGEATVCHTERNSTAQPQGLFFILSNNAQNFFKVFHSVWNDPDSCEVTRNPVRSSDSLHGRNATSNCVQSASSRRPLRLFQERPTINHKERTLIGHHPVTATRTFSFIKYFILVST